MEKPKNLQKVSIFSKIKAKYIGIKHDFVVKKNKYLMSEDYIALKNMVLEIGLLGLLCYLGYLAFQSDNFLIKIIGFGSALWIIRDKIVPVLTELFGSISIVKIYK